MPLQFSLQQQSFLPSEERTQIERAQQDPRYFAPLYERYHDAIFRYVYRRVDEEEQAHDITSSVFVKALQSIHKYEYRGLPFGAWLFRIAKSELYQSFRDQKAQRTVSIDKVVLKQVIEEWTEDYTEQDKARLLIALKDLKEQQLQLIEMRFFEKRSFKEIGDICGLSENNAKVKTFRAVLKLKEFFHQKE
jgi:RNA polymerase sigma-70 factor (ECF subfamily)